MAIAKRIETLSVSIQRAPSDVYDFISNPENLPRWATGLGSSVRREGTAWIVGTRAGPVEVRFAERNPWGILDHTVKLAGGEVFIPMRVVPNGDGSAILFTLLQSAEMTDEQFASDARTVERDLSTLRELLEE